jgi:hypothetical protein
MNVVCASLENIYPIVRQRSAGLPALLQALTLLRGSYTHMYVVHAE